MSSVPSEGTRWDRNRGIRDRIRRASVYVDDVPTCLYLLRGWLASLERRAAELMDLIQAERGRDTSLPR